MKDIPVETASVETKSHTAKTSISSSKSLKETASSSLKRVSDTKADPKKSVKSKAVTETKAAEKIVSSEDEKEMIEHKSKDKLAIKSSKSLKETSKKRTVIIFYFKLNFLAFLKILNR